MKNCLTTEQILRYAWRFDEDVSPGEHVAECDACRQQVERWLSVPENIRSELASDDRLAAGRIRLLELLALPLDEAIHESHENRSHENESTLLPDVSHEGREGEPFAAAISLFRNPGAFAVRHKRSLSAVCLLVLLAVVFRPLSGSGESLAQETAKAISKAKSVRYEMTQTVVVDLGKKTLEVSNKGRGFWVSNGARREEIFQDGKLDQVSIMFRDRMGVDINHRTRSFRALGPRAGQMSPLMKIQQLGSFKGKADQELGDQEIDGVASSGFELAMNKVDDAAGDSTIQVWVSKKTHLPVRLVYKMKFIQQDATMVMEKFEWNIALDESLFNSTPPPGYTDETPTPPDASQQTAEITEALKVYAKAFDGKYPRGKTVYDVVVINALSEKLGLANLTPTEQLTQPSVVDFSKSQEGFSMLSDLLRDNPKAAWNGSSVTVKDKDKVLLSWQTADGFQVLFGDLKSKTVKTEAELEKLAKE
jgi:outer membrane lipoprotein-sorting protein